MRGEALLKSVTLIAAGTLLLVAGLISVTRATQPADLVRVPDVKFQRLDGSSIALADFRGKVVLLNFWGTWCVPCLQEIPELVDLAHRHQKKGLVVVGIAIDSGRPEDIREFAAAHGMDYPILQGELSIAKRFFHVVGFPTSLLVDRNGMIRKRYFGPQTAEVLKHDVEPLL